MLLDFSIERVHTCSEIQIAELEAKVRWQLNGRLHHFELVEDARGLILRGHAPTYFAKQLAQEAVMRASEVPILDNAIKVY